MTTLVMGLIFIQFTVYGLPHAALRVVFCHFQENLLDLFHQDCAFCNSKIKHLARSIYSNCHSYLCAHVQKKGGFIRQ